MEETRKATEMLLSKIGRPLDGQTTNPTLIAKKLKNRQQITDNRQQKKISQKEALDEYKRIVQEMSRIIPQGSISIQVFANQKTSAEEMLVQAKERIKWIPNGSIKFPCNHEGLTAAQIACQEMPINITLVFSQSQGAAVYEATIGAKYPVFISPFVGRLDDRGENGMDVVKNIKEMYKNSDPSTSSGQVPSTSSGQVSSASLGQARHVQILTASVRNLDHILYALQLQSDIISIPFKIFQLWVDSGFQMPDNNYQYKKDELKVITFQEDIVLGKNWQEYDLSADLTKIGVDRFYEDWMELFNI